MCESLNVGVSFIKTYVYIYINMYGIPVLQYVYT